MAELSERVRKEIMQHFGGGHLLATVALIDLENIALLAAEEERKACAEVCVKVGTAENSPYGAIAWDCAEAIEARGKA